ncbi:MAG TPA: hypothetical protein VKU02_08030 [Gemmataceae bacterium]|nr:hypothetical protein [Gemmataceae bacterium]
MMRSSAELTLHHLDRLTDSTGLIQHGIYNVPRRESGYTTDDNARALRLCTRLWGRHPDEHMLNRVTRYLSFLEFARRPGGGFHNFLSYQRQWLDTQGGGDCQGQAVRALAEVLGSGLPDDYRALARELVEAVLPTLADLRSIRAQAYVTLAWGHLWSAGVKDIDPLQAVAWSAAQRLMDSYDRARRPDWPWFDSRMTYANAILPHALFVAARRWPKEPFLEVAEASFAFLDRETTVDDYFCPVGNDGWYPHGGAKAAYDQQPVEADTMGDAALAAFGLLGEPNYLASFQRTLGWFRGANSLKRPLIDARRGACYDGLQPTGVNRNQGAESTLAYLAAELHDLEVQHALAGGSQAAVVGA